MFVFYVCYIFTISFLLLSYNTNEIQSIWYFYICEFDSTVSFSKVVLSQGAVNQVFLGVFLMFLSFFHIKIWAKFHFGNFEPYE